MRIRSFWVLLLLGAGCTSYDTKIFNLTVKNQSAGPITIWLTKDGPPYEAGWLAPEDIAIESPKLPDRIIGGVIVPQGKTVGTGTRAGKFEHGTHAILRVYGGKLTFAELLASSEDSKNRVDLNVPPGRSYFTVTGDPNSIDVEETNPADLPSTTAPNHAN